MISVVLTVPAQAALTEQQNCMAEKDDHPCKRSEHGTWQIGMLNKFGYKHRGHS